MHTTQTYQIAYDAKYDILKLILSIMVVAIHATIYPMILYPWLRIAVPLFFIISSYFLFSKLQEMTVCAHWGEIKKFVIRNIRLYTFWCIVLLPFTLYIRRDFFFSENIGKFLFRFLKSLFFGSAFVASWYIIASIIGVLLIWKLAHRMKHVKVCLIVLSVFCLVTLYSSYQSIFQTCTAIVWVIRGYNLILGNPVFSFPASLFWIFIGKCFAENRIKLLPWSVCILFLSSSSALLYFEWKFVQHLNGTFNNDSYFMLAPVCISFFMCFQKIKPISWRYAKSFRQLSTVIYVTHGTLLSVIGFLYRRVLQIDSRLLNFCTVLLCSTLIYLMIREIRQQCKESKLAAVIKSAY